MTRPIIRAIIKPIIRGIKRAADTLLFQSDLQNSLIPAFSTGSGTPTYTGATTKTVPDFEGIVKTALASEARFKGARRVRNLFPASDDLEDAGWNLFRASLVSGQTDPDGGSTAYRMTMTSGASSGINETPITEAGTTNVTTWWVKRVTGTGVIKIYNGNGSTQIAVESFVTDEWQRIALDPAAGTGGSSAGGILLFTIGDAIDIWHPQMEDITGQANQNPSEYVSSGVLSSPYHGANVDAVKYFNTLNGNTVSSNVVTEATGIPITDVGVEEFDGTFPTVFDPTWSESPTGTFTNDGTNVGDANLQNSSMPYVAGRRTKLTFNIESISGGNLIVYNNTGGGNAFTTPGVKTMDSIDSNSSLFLFRASAGVSCVVSEISKKAVHYYADANGPYGYMAELAATNTQVYSQEYDNAAWTLQGGTVTADATAGPSGATTMDRFVVTATASNHNAYDAFVAVSGTNYAVSHFMKDDGAGFGGVCLGAGVDFISVVVNLSTGAVTDTEVGATSGTIVASGAESFGNGIWRVWIAGSIASTSGFNIPFASDSGTPTYASGRPTYTGVLGEDIYLGGAQLEVGTFPTSYTGETTTTAVTRNADALTYPRTGNISDTAGTVVIDSSADSETNLEMILLASASSGRWMYTSGAANSNRTFEGSNSSVAPTGTSRFGSPQPSATTWGDFLTAYAPGTLLPDLTPGSYVGSFAAGDIGVACYGNVGTTQFKGTHRFLRIYSNEKSDAEVLALG